MNRPATSLAPSRLALQTCGAPGQPTPSPWTRLRRLIRLERRELWVLLVFAVVIGSLSLAVPVAVQVLVNTIAFGTLLQPLVILTLLLAGVLVLTGAVQIAEWYAVEVLQRRLLVRVSEDFAHRFATARRDASDRRDFTRLAIHFLDVVPVQKAMSRLLLDGLGLVLQTIVAVALLAFYHPMLLAFDVLLIICLALVVAVGIGAVPTAIAESRAKYDLASWLNGVASNHGLFARPASTMMAAERTDELTRAYLTTRTRHYRRILRHLVGGTFLQIFAMVALLGLGGTLVMRGELTLGQLVAAELIVGTIASGYTKIGKHLETGYDLLAALDKLGAVLDLPVHEDTADPRDDQAVFELQAKQMVVAREGWRNELPIDASIDRRARTLLDGAGGSGKTTVLETLAGLRNPADGELRFNDTHLPKQTASRLRREAFLLRRDDIVVGTLLDNLRIGRPELTESEAWRALKSAGLDEQIRAMPDGLETRVLASGSPLSQSERARLSVARALVARPRLLLVDGGLDELGLPPERNAALLEEMLGADAPWAVAATSADPEVRRRLSTRITPGPSEVQSW